MTKREKMHACVLYNPNDETIMAERSESPSLSVKRFFFLSPAGSCRAPALPERSRAVPRCVFILSVSPSYRGTTRRPPLSEAFRKRPRRLSGFAGHKPLPKTPAKIKEEPKSLAPLCLSTPAAYNPILPPRGQVFTRAHTDCQQYCHLNSHKPKRITK